MNARTLRQLAAILAVAVASAALAAEERPSEDALFGAPAAGPAPAAAPAPAPAPSGEPAAGKPSRDDAILGHAQAGAPAGLMTPAQENPLAIGGQAYLRATTTWTRSAPARDWPLATPNLLDLYADARPNDRVRAFALARTRWDPVAPPAGSGFPASEGPDPVAALDQLWVNFDVGRTVFVTAGRQHVKWGVGRFWNPTDFLHPVRRDPLAPFDDRTGTTMIKLHVPWEARGWNVYGIALLDDPSGHGDAANQLGKVAWGGRAEVVIGPAELGADALARDGQRPRFGFDFSAGIWDLDVHGEVAFRTSSDVQLWKDANPGAGTVLQRYGPTKLDGITPQAVLGVSYAVNYSDEDAVRIAAEYFYNGLGYDDPHIYPWLMAQPALFADQPADVKAAIDAALAGKGNDFTSFYAGRQYAGLSVLLAKPGSWNDHTFTLSAIANLSDGSGVVRLDHAVIVDTWLTVESWISANLGKEGGEFRFSLNIPPQSVTGPAGTLTHPIRTEPPVLSGGVALRVKL